MRFSLSTTLVLACALALGVVGCGDDDKPAAGSGGTGGGGTGGGGTGGGGTGGTGGGAPHMCGATTCDDLPMGVSIPIPVPGLPMPAHCCTPDDNLCGIASDGLLKAGTCLEQNAEGVDTAMCPTEMLSFPNPLDMTMSFPIPLAGCCRPDNQCGLSSVLTVPILGSLDLGTGCTERAHLADSLDTSMLGGALTWASMGCTYTPTDLDAGTGDDAGN